MRPFHDGAFLVGVPSHVELDALTLQHALKRFVQKFVSPIRLYPYRPPAYRLRVFGSLRTD